MISFHGKKYVYQVLEREKRENFLNNVNNFPTLEVSKRKACEIELICIGAFSPLTHFMNKSEVMEVAFKLSLDGILWSIPIILPASKDIFEKVQNKDKVILKQEKIYLAVLELEDKFTLCEEEKEKIAQAIYKTTSLEHPGVKEFMKEGKYYLSGKVYLLNRPKREEGISNIYYL